MAKLAVGSRVATVLPEDKVMLVLTPFMKTLEPITVAGFIASENVTVTLVFTATFVAPLAGETLLTVGGVVSAAAVVKVLVN